MPTHPPLFTHTTSPIFPPCTPTPQKTMLHQRIELNPIKHIKQSYDSYSSISFGAKTRKTAQNYERYRNWNEGGVQFRPENVEDESGVCSPPLWRTSPPTSPVHAHNPRNNFRSLSPSSQSQAIARGQWELMEMVKNMPESCYELSLKDLVEPPREDCSKVEERNFKVRRQESNKIGKKTKMIRSESMESKGLFLKMAFPFSFRSKKKKNSAQNTCAKVSPRPEASSDKFSKRAEKDWWKKKFSASSGSGSGLTSSNSGSTSSSGSNGSNRSSSRSNSKNNRKQSCCLPACPTFFRSKKSKFAM